MESRRRELLAWIYQESDAHGECDRCHNDSVGLWSLPPEIDKEYEAGWMYCKKCFTLIVERHYP